MKSFYLLPALSALGSCTKLILPLYIYPYPATLWDPIYDAIAANPDLDFQVVVNPDSGPGDASLPNSDYLPAIAKLNTYSNVELIGYVHTLYAAESLSAVETNVSTYASWSSYTASDIAVNGIFFDETSNVDDETTYDYMSALSSYTYNLFGDDASLIFNLGTYPNNLDLYNLATTLITSELAWSDYEGVALSSLVPSGYEDKSSVIVHSYTGSASTLETSIQAVVDAGIQSTYFTSSDSYTEVTSTPATIGVVAADLAAAQ